MCIHGECVEPAGLCGRCTGVAVPLRVVPSPTGPTPVFLLGKIPRIGEPGGHSLLQGIFLTQGSNPGLPHCRQSLYQMRAARVTGPRVNGPLSKPERCWHVDLQAAEGARPQGCRGGLRFPPSGAEGRPVARKHMTGRTGKGEPSFPPEGTEITASSFVLISEPFSLLGGWTELRKEAGAQAGICTWLRQMR